jgi:hypothetical protein
MAVVTRNVADFAPTGVSTLTPWTGAGAMRRRAIRLSVALLTSGQLVPYGFGLSTREFLGHPMIWHGGNVDGHSALIGYIQFPNDGSRDSFEFNWGEVRSYAQRVRDMQ